MFQQTVLKYWVISSRKLDWRVLRGPDGTVSGGPAAKAAAVGRGGDGGAFRND